MFGIYIHVPFCSGKCPYCDFYSVEQSPEAMDQYTARVAEILRAGGKTAPRVDTVYFGGGTPSLLGARRLEKILEGILRAYSLNVNPEITLEANPTGVTREFFAQVYRAGFNRLSMGLQSAHPEELRFLGRAHSPEDVIAAVDNARAGGFQNISLDLMMALPGSTRERLGKSIEFAAALAPEHLSAYLLKIEPGTPFARRTLKLPTEEESAGEYLFAVNRLGELGYAQYEISNFSRPGYESRHNLLYWTGREYRGIGPGAHGFENRRRYFYPSKLEAFLQGNSPEDEGPGGDFEEYAMLNLRLTQGLARRACVERFGEEANQWFTRMAGKAGRLPKTLVEREEDRIHFTPEGFLVSNALIGALLSE